MTGRRANRVFTALMGAVMAVALTSCSGSSGQAVARKGNRADCTVSVTSLLAVTQRYLNGVGQPGGAANGQASPSSQTSAAADEKEFTAAVRDISAYAVSLGCDPGRFQADLTQGLARLRTRGPLANAVLLQLRAQSGGATAGHDPLQPGDNVAAAVAAAPSATTVRLGPGTFVLPQTLALIRGVTVAGSGRDRTRLVSSAADGTVLVLTSEPTELSNLTVSRAGSTPGSVIDVAPVSQLTVRQARVSGGRLGPGGRDGAGIVLAAGVGGQTGASRRTTLVLLDSELLDNAAAGLVASGDHRVDVRRTLVARSKQCGICFLDRSDGVVRDSSLVDDAVGLLVTGAARPTLLRSQVRGGRVGVQASGTARPWIRDNVLSGTDRSAMIWAGTARGRIEGNRCDHAPFGIVVGPKVLPFVGTNSCTVNRGRE